MLVFPIQLRHKRNACTIGPRSAIMAETKQAFLMDAKELEHEDAAAQRRDTDAEAVAAPEPRSAYQETDPETEDLPEEPYVWQASEYMHHEKGAAWYASLGAGVLLLVLIAILTKQWLSIAVFASMAAAIFVYARKPPRTLTYQLDSKGITVEDKLFPFETFHSFAVLPDVEWHAIDLDPTRRFMPRLTVLFTDESYDEIVARLERHLPRVEREPDLIERLSRRLRF